MDNIGSTQKATAIKLLREEAPQLHHAKAPHSLLLDMRSKFLGPIHEDIIASLCDLATLSYKIGDCKEAKRMHTEAREAQV